MGIEGRGGNEENWRRTGHGGSLFSSLASVLLARSSKESATCWRRTAKLVPAVTRLAMRDLTHPIKAEDFKTHVDDRAAVESLSQSNARFQVTRRGRVYGVCMGGLGDMESLVWLHSLPKLRSFSVATIGARKWFGDAELAAVVAVPQLRAVAACTCERVTASRVCASGRFDHIRWLALPSCQVADEGVNEIQRLSNLFSLSLIGSTSSDKVLKGLDSLRNLWRLHLGVTNASPTTIDHLAASLQRCQIYMPDRSFRERGRRGRSR
ncbi:hypothetical protein Pla123a_20660 [Posidoniimonas polymericola]|uniref:Leucine Rich repeats (2 copies) n=1 Tax=Posidoniimonas polymericola TaxID=2528002 RepID=A0A5C5YRA3_9BACT|nr:hypothetical protein Pla123a_20660 [Posidoniimonas polymericola]